MKKILSTYVGQSLFLLLIMFNVCLFFFYSINFTHADTVKTGIVSANEVWSKEMSPIVVRDLVIQSNSKVTVEPGVEVRLEGDEEETLLVQGKFVLNGVKDMPIVLIGNLAQGHTVKFHSSFDFDHMSSLSNVQVKGGVKLLIEQSNIEMNSIDFDVNDTPIYVLKSVVFVNRLNLSAQSPEIFVKDSFFRLIGANISGADSGTGINIINSDFAISSSTISSRRIGIMLEKSYLDIYGSHITNNNTGIRIVPHFNPSPAINDNSENLNMGGIGNVFDSGFSILRSMGQFDKTKVRISKSAFIGNGTHIINEDGGVLDSSLNRWSISKDFTNPLSTKYGKNLSSVPALSEAHSNLVFVPGIQGTRLFAHLPGEKDRQAWEPYLASGFESLNLRKPPEGVSISVGDVIESAYHSYPIYQPLMSFLRSNVANRIIKSFIPYAYDWRYLTGSNVLDSGVESGLASAIYNLALSSPTGKVSVIAHSYGGLVTKNLLKDFSNSGISYFIDKVLLVASPELGTPQALGSLLHGYGQEILKGAVFTETEAKKLAESIPSPYELLPSSKYPIGSNGPTIEIVDGARKYLGVDFPEYEKSSFQRSDRTIATSSIIKTGSGFKDFLSRIISSSPTTLFGDISSNYVSNAFSAHEFLDKSDLEQGFSGKVLRIIGTGLPTYFGTLYDEVYKCRLIFIGEELCKNELKITHRLGNNGDGTVLENAQVEDGNAIKLDLAIEKENSHRDLSHARIFDSPTLQKYLNIWLVNNTEEARSIIASTTNVSAKDGRRIGKDNRKNGRVKKLAQDVAGIGVGNVPAGAKELGAGLVVKQNDVDLQKAVMLKISNEGKASLKVCLYNNKCTGVDSSTKFPPKGSEQYEQNTQDMQGYSVYNKFSDIPKNPTIEDFRSNGIIIYDDEISGSQYSISDNGSSLVMLIEKESLNTTLKRSGDAFGKGAKYDPGVSYYKIILSGKDTELDRISISLLDGKGNYLKTLFYKDIVTSPKLRAEADITVINIVDGGTNKELKIFGSNLKTDSDGDGVFDVFVQASENGLSKYDPRSSDYIYKDNKKTK